MYGEMDRRPQHGSHLHTRERIMGQRGKLKALAGISEFHLLFFRGCNETEV